jgi:hypothetical protein
MIWFNLPLTRFIVFLLFFMYKLSFRFKFLLVSKKYITFFIIILID